MIAAVRRVVLAAVLLAAAACSRGSTPPAAPLGNAAELDASGDSITVFATHTESRPKDPVELRFRTFKVTKAAFDPKDLAGGTATIAIDLASLETDEPKRDAHLRSPEYLDTAKFTTATIDVFNVKTKGGAAYRADAKINLHGVEKTYAVSFHVVAARGNSIQIAGEHTFDRTDFRVGGAIVLTDPQRGDGVAAELTIRLKLTLTPH